MLSSLNKHDYANLLALLQRVPVTGLNEAQALVVLGGKLQTAVQTPDVEAVKEDAKAE
jgi:hypothetical protein